ncbi:cytochrome oxidase assembly protein ShyY1 [Microterricola gilva]|uniref:SURF1-like protein n=2 Tax=Microterricola gilva TaxID=393267 RepID=A0A4V2GAG4_9MICO|nr:cytochrome oxidase assembly protein ShyY1 [Microterricola gilva]
MLSIMVRPRWILALLGALAVAAVFALLGQWQLKSAMESGEVEERTTEVVQPLTEVANPADPIRQTATGQMVSVDGHFIGGDEQIIAGRLNGGVAGYWVVSHFAVELPDSPGIPVARGWAADAETAEQVAATLAEHDSAAETISITGRLLPSEGPEVPADGTDPHEMRTVAVSALINLWSDFDNQSVYTAYIVGADAPAGLAEIDSPEPNPEIELNWLNIFYAVEWAVFAGFAVFLWYRLVRDAWEREREAAEEAAAQDAAVTPAADESLSERA